MNNKMMIIAAALVVVGGGLAVFALGDNNTQSNNSSSSTATQTPANNIVTKADVEASAPAQEYTTIDQASTKGSYEPYSEARIANDTGSTVLFFNASWCPTCQTAKANFQENANNIPGEIRILDVDFDSNAELRKRYGVTVQHTFVQVDDEGNKIKSWTGSYVVDQLISQLEA